MREQAQWMGEPVDRMTAGTAAADPAGHIYLIGRTSFIHVFFIGIVPRNELFFESLTCADGFKIFCFLVGSETQNFCLLLRNYLPILKIFPVTYFQDSKAVILTLN
jgi:hypothetical protein